MTGSHWGQLKYGLYVLQAVSLDKKGSYTEPHTTQRYNVPFFSKAGGDFLRSYPKGSSSRVRLEQVRSFS